jgi:actin-related protein
MTSLFKRSYSSNVDIASRQSNPLVFEFGAAYLRIGIAGESKPRSVIPLFSSLEPRPSIASSQEAPTVVSSSGTEDDYWSSSCTFPRDLFLVKSSPGYEDLGPWFRNLYTHHLLLKPRSRRVIILLPIYHAFTLRTSLETIFLTQLQVPSILFTNTFETIPYAIGEPNAGMIVDIGEKEGRIVCFFHGNMCENTLQIVPVGYRVTLKLLNVDDKCCATLQQNDENQEKAPKQIIENLLFDLDNTNSLMYAFLSCLLECPIDLRKLVVQHVVFVGGGVEGISLLEKRFLTFIRGLFVEKTRVKSSTSVQENIPIYGIRHERYHQFDKLASVIMTAPLGVMYPLPFRPSCMAWVGASIMGSTQRSNSSDDGWIHRSESLRFE